MTNDTTPPYTPTDDDVGYGKAHKSYLKKKGQLEATPEGKAKYGAILDRIYGPLEEGELFEVDGDSGACEG